jgi:hypothetical protein
MIYIEQGETNKIVLTLTENATIVNPYWLFEFENEYNTDSQPIYWTMSDESAYPERYNLFELIEGVEVNLIKGQYFYKVYESADPIIIDPNTTPDGLNLVEEGRMVVWGQQLNTIYD